MKITGNTVLITGGGSGIGRGLAEALQAAGNKVIVAGRRAGPLSQVVEANPGIRSAVIDVADARSIHAFAEHVATDFPDLNILINNAGIMKQEDALGESVDLSVCDETIAINLLGPIRLTAALLPHLRRQPSATIVNVTSGLAFVPRADTPTYSATKAAMHSYTQSLRFLLRHTTVGVIELAPPLVATDLTPGQRSNPRAMPLEDFIRESMELFAAPGSEVLVERVKMQRFAEVRGDFEKVFGMINAA